MVDLSSIFVNGERRNLSCFIRRASCKAPCFPGNLLQGKWWTFLGNVPGVSQCVARPLNLFFPGMMIKRRRRLLNIYAKIPPESIETLSIAEIQIIISSKFLKFGNFFCLIFPLVPLSSIQCFIIRPKYFSRENLSRDAFEDPSRIFKIAMYNIFQLRQIEKLIRVIPSGGNEIWKHEFAKRGHNLSG